MKEMLGNSTCLDVHNINKTVYHSAIKGFVPSTQQQLLHRASGNGTAGMAMAVLVFEGEKWRHLDSNLPMRYIMASPSGSP